MAKSKKQKTQSAQKVRKGDTCYLVAAKSISWFPATKVTGSSIIREFNFLGGINVSLLPQDMDI